MDPQYFDENPNVETNEETTHDPHNNMELDPRPDPRLDPRMNNPYNSPYTRRFRKRNEFARTSVLCVVFAIISISTVYLPIFFASLGILFAMLSREDSMQMPKNARISCVICSFILVGMIVLIVLVMRWLFVTFPMDVLTDPQALYDALMQYMINMGIDPASLTGGVI